MPMIFQPYAEDMASRVTAEQPLFVLEVAAGTGWLECSQKIHLGFCSAPRMVIMTWIN
ncbi:hypothetical protein [Limnobacter humi]|uniref:hypothetical protein n=1 Tax=Limnobacter humi TaxID=1778671 RepID=UPI0021177E0E|nr:hypothetical protein [Limnobacter humi]